MVELTTALAHEKLYLQMLPNCQMYERSFMHRDVVTHVIFTEYRHPLYWLTCRTEFLITASADGHLKFWKKYPVGIEFVKHFRAHLGKKICFLVSLNVRVGGGACGRRRWIAVGHNIQRQIPQSLRCH